MFVDLLLISQPALFNHVQRIYWTYTYIIYNKGSARWFFFYLTKNMIKVSR